ncbi:putative 2-oxoglutarate-dependent dioxygenase AOP1.2 [Morella rubra]|uniref:Putative 2-oxoglutarate-dependent dioxygenase AOP1.2 n=1 Tax=Morella rubra TaxID=262757 RepID=A0A6A1WQZ3_9ROSI|nr:putative 2-oxoglutarate-dependent dioxygenase AOP1.2 [Morella rubra]
MASNSPLIRLPVIDFSKPELKPGTPDWDSLRAQVRQALEEYGCFEALFNKVHLELRKALLGAIDELFDLPLPTKLRNVSKRPFHGYIGQHPEVPLYESLGIDDANIPENVKNQANILWPEGKQSFCNTIQSFSEQVSELDQMIRRMVLESLGVEKYLDEHMGSTKYVLRVMKYQGPQTTETKLGLKAHTDINMVTILYQNEVEGLEVKTQDGEWINFIPSPDSFAVMIGDSLLAWTNGRLHSPHHRVMMTGNKARYSVGLFSVPKAGYIIEAPEELVDEEHPLLFKPFDYDQFLAFYYTEAGQNAKSALSTYCGV